MPQNTQNTQTPLPAVSLPLPAFAEQAAPVVERIVTVLSGRAKTCILPVQTTATFTRMVNGKATKRVLAGAKSPLELTSPDKAGNRPHNTFTRDQVLAIAREVVAIMNESPSPVDVRDRVPSYALGDGASAADIAKVLSLTYTPKKGNSAGVERNAAAHCVGAYRANIRRLAKSNHMTATLKAGDGFFGNADAIINAKLPQSRGIKAAFAKQVQAALLDKNGDPRPYPSESKAKKAVCRAIFGADWYETDKADRLTLAATFVYGQADSVGKADQGRVTRAAAATLDNLAPAALRALAKKAGAPKSVFTGTGSTARCRQWFSDDITRLEGVMTPQ